MELVFILIVIYLHNSHFFKDSYLRPEVLTIPHPPFTLDFWANPSLTLHWFSFTFCAGLALASTGGPEEV
jgi:hypothetical protein